VTVFEEGLACHGHSIELRHNLASALMQTGELLRARDQLHTALESKPDFAEAHNNLGLVLRDLGTLEQAFEHFERAAALGLAQAHINIGNMHADQGRREQARQAYRRAIELQSDNAGAYHNLADEELLANNLEGSEQALRNAIRFNHDTPQRRTNLAMAHTNLAMLLLGRGEFAEGWREYQWRDGGPVENPWRPGHYLPPVSSFAATDLIGKHLVLTPDQGLGDEIFFLRFAAQARAMGARITTYASSKIAGLLARCCDFTVRDVANSTARAPDADLVLRAGDLPLLLDVRAPADIVSPMSLQADSDTLFTVKRELQAAGPPPYLGITWRAGTTNRAALQKEIPLQLLLDAVADWPGTVVVLQRNPREDELATVKATLGAARVADRSDLNENLEGMLALLSLLDEYTGVSNTNVHLRASLRRSARVLVPFPPDWRWMNEGDSSPWFPGMLVYRQSPDLDWAPCLHGLRAGLSEALAG
jgi:tetratricopeptide (TPR) repeat protein